MNRNLATTERVGFDAMLAFVRSRHRIVLTTFRADGSPQSSPVTAGVDPHGRLVVATYPQRAKTRNLRRDPRASAAVLSDEWDGPWVQLDGTVEVIDVPDAVEPLVDYFRAIAGEHPDWDEYRQAMVDQDKSLLRMRIERWGPISTGGFPPELAQRD